MVLFFKPHCFFSTSIVLNSNRKKELVFQSYLLFLLYLLFFLCRKKLICFSPPFLATQSFIQCLLNKRKTKEEKTFSTKHISPLPFAHCLLAVRVICPPIAPRKSPKKHFCFFSRKKRKEKF